MSNLNTQYETLYGVGLLDDLHNYFPAILYDPTRFRGIQDLLHYLQTNARSRFDLFSFGQRAYLNTHLEASPSSSSPPASYLSALLSDPLVAGPRLRGSRFEQEEETAARPPRQPNAPSQNPNGEAPPIIRTNEPRISTHIEITQEDLGLDNQALSLLNLMNILTGVAPLNRTYRNPNLPSSFLEPVVVRPTLEQIERGSSRAFPPEETTCAICQDAIPVNQMARRLNACGHTFHISCIDQWYGRDVRCPTCRHDIREPGQQQQQQDEEANNADDERGEEVN